MNALTRGSLRLFRLFGITVYLNWMWIFAVLYFMYAAGGVSFWNFLFVLALFGIVLAHEFGHALACRSVGGQADTIVLWPLGGVAYVSPPWRPGAMLWSIVAGPLVNVALAPVLWALLPAPVRHQLLGVTGALLPIAWLVQAPRVTELLLLCTPAQAFVLQLLALDLAVLTFNLMPVYPLDGGKILWSALWFFIGETRALRVASILGIIGAGGFMLLAFAQGSLWLVFIAVFILVSALSAFRQAGAVQQARRIPRHRGLVCPNCHIAPACGNFWQCGACGVHFDMFAHHGRCPQCGANYLNNEIQCLDCRRMAPVSGWFTAATVEAAPTGAGSEAAPKYPG